MGGDPETLLIASPNGTGDGTIIAPYSLAGAVANALDGCTIMLQAGTYTITGQMVINNDVSLRADGNVIIDGFLLFGGACGAKDLVFTNSAFSDRISAQSVPDPNDLSVSPYAAITIDEHGAQIINCIIHDTPTGVLVQPNGGNNTLIYGCVVYLCGWQSPNQLTYGHGLYPANDGSSGNVLTIENCIVFSGFGYGVHDYGTTQNNIMLKNCIVFKSGELSGRLRDNILQGASHVEGKLSNNLNWIGNCTYGGDASGNDYGFGSSAVSGILQDNYCPDGIVKSGVPTSETGNAYAPETEQRVFVFPNSRRSFAAHVACYNWTNANTIEVDLSTVAGLVIGDTVNVWNVQAGIGNDIQVLVLDANKRITVNMQAANRSIADPIGNGWTAPTETFPTFGAFVVTKA